MVSLINKYSISTAPEGVSLVFQGMGIIKSFGYLMSYFFWKGEILDE